MFTRAWVEYNSGKAGGENTIFMLATPLPGDNGLKVWASHGCGCLHTHGAGLQDVKDLPDRPHGSLLAHQSQVRPRVAFC